MEVSLTRQKGRRRQLQVTLHFVISVSFLSGLANIHVLPTCGRIAEGRCTSGDKFKDTKMRQHKLGDLVGLLWLVGQSCASFLHKRRQVYFTANMQANVRA